MTADGLTLYFTSIRVAPHFTMDIYVATRGSIADPFAVPALYSDLHGPENEGRFFLSQDGLRAYMHAGWPDGVGGADLWQAERATTATPFARADFALMPEANTDGNEFDPMESADGLTLYYATSGMAAGQGGQELAVVTRASIGDAFSSPTLITELNSPSSEDSPWVSSDQLVIIYGTKSVSGDDNDLYVATRADPGLPFSTPTLLPAVNSEYHEGEVFVHEPSLMLYFVSTRPGPGSWDIYTAQLVLE